VTRTVAAFDFDGTLTRRDSLLPFLASIVGWPRLAVALGAQGRQFARDRDVAKELLLVRLLAGHSGDALRAAGRAYAQTVRIEPQMRERVDWHRAQGHELVIVSASLDVYLTDVARGLGVDHILCTAVEVADARCTGKLLGGNCRGPEKAKRLRAHLGDGDVVLWAYGDSAGDTEMLAMADHPVRVKRGRLVSRQQIGH
jgi:phosphatidylglycerophosphatase C